MALYFFHHQECGGLVEDQGGHECDDLHAAELHALSLARKIIAKEVLEGELCLGCSVDIFDKAGRKMLSVPFRRAVMVTGL